MDFSSLPSATLKQLNDDLECTICYQQIADRIFQCGHSFCGVCVKRILYDLISDIITVNHTGESDTGKDCMQIKCPKCRGLTSLSSVSRQMILNWTSNNAGDKLEDLVDNRWLSCFPINYTARQVQQTIGQIQWCSKHSNEICNSWCWNCMSPVCPRCLEIADSGCNCKHNVQTLHESFQSLHKRFEELSEKHQELQNLVLGNYQKTCDPGKICELKQKIDQVESLFVQKITHEKSRLIEKLDKYQTSMLNGWNEFAVKNGYFDINELILNMKDFSSELYAFTNSVHQAQPRNPNDKTVANLTNEQMIQKLNEARQLLSSKLSSTLDLSFLKHLKTSVEFEPNLPAVLEHNHHHHHHQHNHHQVETSMLGSLFLVNSGSTEAAIVDGGGEMSLEKRANVLLASSMRGMDIND